MLLHIFKVEKLGFKLKSTENKFEHPTWAGLDGDCGTLNLDLPTGLLAGITTICQHWCRNRRADLGGSLIPR